MAKKSYWQRKYRWFVALTFILAFVLVIENLVIGTFFRIRRPSKPTTGSLAYGPSKDTTPSKDAIISGHTFVWEREDVYTPRGGVKIALLTIDGKQVDAYGKHEWFSEQDGTYRMEIPAKAPVSILFMSGEDLIPSLHRISAKAGHTQQINISFLSYEQPKKLINDTKALGPKFAAQLDDLLSELQMLSKDNLARQHIARLSELRKWVGEFSLVDERSLAEEAVALGGVISVNDNDINLEANKIRVREGLPRGKIRIKCIDFTGKTGVNDRILQKFAKCEGLKHLALGGTKVTDNGLVHLKPFKELGYLDLGGGPKKLTDNGMFFLRDCRKLEYLGLVDTDVGDTGLKYLDLSSIRWATLMNSKITNEGLKLFHNCKQLQKLVLVGNGVTAEGVNALAVALPGRKFIKGPMVTDDEIKKWWDRYPPPPFQKTVILVPYAEDRQD